MTLAIYRDIDYDFEYNIHFRYTLLIDGQYMMHYIVSSCDKNEEKDVIERVRRKVLCQPYIKSMLNPFAKIKYMPQGELVHKENNTKLLKELEVKLRIKELEEDFK